MACRALTHRVGVLLVFLLVLSGCERGARLSVVKAVAIGVPSLAPFFDERLGLGRDARVPSGPVPGGGLQQGDTPGLYGGTREASVCDVERLEDFLTDPANARKAQAWADVLDTTRAGIPEYLDRLTPALLRHDTLVKNHDYKKGKSVSFDSLLQAGIAILVDERGLPAVKCSCGNPLRPFQGDTDRISVTFGGDNKKWRGYDRASVVAVEPAPRNLPRLALVDVDEPGRGIERPVGTAGEKDTTFNASRKRAVPAVAGATFGEASRRLTERGLAVAYEGGAPPADEARVVGSDPAAGTGLPFGEYVTLRVAGASSGGDGSTAPDGGRTTPPGTPIPEPSETDGTTTGGPSGTSTPPSSSPAGTSVPPPPSPSKTSAPPPSSSSAPPPPPSSSSAPPPPPPPSSSPPPPSSASAPPASSAPPPPSSPPAPPPSSASQPPSGKSSPPSAPPPPPSSAAPPPTTATATGTATATPPAPQSAVEP
ncbi:PASTA domain-containing protein [Streptomyces aurantiogriseus]|uniref:PASTA domain-containing protein n=1 Tax=Streptomyces aurantiogriseus TaxID=66870 RepID=A0A918CK26_9ACTN|nr:PASTA domain-containing protein [Streptomyces aurantiogriseus]GGR28654.1 hypothetical protein GCM10010251_51000 [Streptomyces aurantiogriseus]